MARVLLTGWGAEVQATAFRAHAEAVELSVYQTIVRALQLGVANLTGGRRLEPEPSPEPPREQVNAIGIEAKLDRLATRAELADQLVQRTLYAAGAAYAAALAGAGEGVAPERAAASKGEVAREADAVSERQLVRAREG